MIEATDARGAYNAVRPVSVKIKPRSTRRADLQGKKSVLVCALICIFKVLVYNMPERACLVRKGR